MIGELPKVLTVSENSYPIRTDFRTALLIFEAYDDPELDDFAKAKVCLECLYEEIPDNIDEALKRAVWFLDGGDMPKSKQLAAKTMDWKQDESLIFPAINKVAGYETRAVDYMHWWSFLGLFSEIGDGLFSQVINIRTKRTKHKKLEKYEQEFYRDHREIIDLKHKYSVEEQKEIDRLNKLLG